MASHFVTSHDRSHRRMHHHHRAAHALSQSNAAFLQAAIPAAQASERESGVPASITLAQACIESGWGRHHIGTANNYFGIKAPLRHGIRSLGTIANGFVEVKTNEYNARHELYEITDAFRTYASMTDSFRDHGIWIRENHHYPGTIDNYTRSGDADAFAMALQNGGYAGHDNIVYGQSLISMMRRHHLYQYNAVQPH